MSESFKGVEPYLRFTVETGEDREFQGWLPILDTSLMVTDSNQIRYRYYEKPTVTQVTVQKTTAKAENPLSFTKCFSYTVEVAWFYST